jgi:hypothetical protein
MTRKKISLIGATWTDAHYTDTKAAGRYSFEDAMNIMIAGGEKGDCTDYILPSPEWIGQRTSALSPPPAADGDGKKG